MCQTLTAVGAQLTIHLQNAPHASCLDRSSLEKSLLTKETLSESRSSQKESVSAFLSASALKGDSPDGSALHQIMTLPLGALPISF